MAAAAHESGESDHMSGPMPEIKRKGSGQLPRMRPEQRKQAKALIRESCCNYEDGNCILLDAPCAQMISGSLCCRWFRWAVLPQDALLESILTASAETKQCVVCGKVFVPKSNRAKYCPDCACAVHRRQKTESERRRRSRVDN